MDEGRGKGDKVLSFSECGEEGDSIRGSIYAGWSKHGKWTDALL